MKEMSQYMCGGRILHDLVRTGPKSESYSGRANRLHRNNCMPNNSTLTRLHTKTIMRLTQICIHSSSVRSLTLHFIFTDSRFGFLTFRCVAVFQALSILSHVLHLPPAFHGSTSDAFFAHVTRWVWVKASA